VYIVPGNHDYYSSGGDGFYEILGEFGLQVPVVRVGREMYQK